MADSVITGLRDLVYCVMTDDSQEIYAAEVKKLPDAISCKITPSASSEKLYANNRLKKVSNRMNEYNLELGFANMTDEVEADLFGHEVDSNYGGVIKKDTDVPPFVAIGGVGTCDDGVEKFFWITKVSFVEPDDSAETDSDKTNYQTPTIKGSGCARMRDGAWKHSVLTSDERFTKAKQETYFDKPYELPSAVALTSIALSEATLALNVDDTSELTVTYTPTTATNKAVTWFSTDTSKVTVSQNGEVKAIAIGTASVVAVSNDGNLTAKCDVTVS